MGKDVNNQGERYLLILSCSKQKKPVSRAPALELYDGPFYRVLRKNAPPNLDVLILSAKYGLIDSNEVISYYDQRMTTNRARELSGLVGIKLKKVLTENEYDEIFVNLGKTYMIALDKSKNILNKFDVYYAKGPIGVRLHQLKGWLNEITNEVTSI